MSTREGVEVIFAQNAAFALAYCFDYAASPEPEHISNAGKCVLETIDAIALEEADDDIDTDPFIDQEVALQRRYIDYISNMDSSAPALAELRALNQTNLVSYEQ